MANQFPEGCDCGCTTDEYSDHSHSCPFYVAGRAARIAAAPAPSQDSQERIAFERWAATELFDLVRHQADTESYRNVLTRNAWLAWQARAKQPETTTAHPDTERLDFLEMNGLDCSRLPTGTALFHVWIQGIRHDGSTPREAIDKARAAMSLPCVWRDGCRSPVACAARGHCDGPPQVKTSSPRCAKHGVELAFEGDGCWECSKEER